LFDNGLYDAERQFCEAIVETQSKRLWYVTVAHIVLASMSLAFVYGTMLALAVLAPQVSTWPLPVFLLLGVTLSVIGLKLAKPVVSRASRRAASHQWMRVAFQFANHPWNRNDILPQHPGTISDSGYLQR
jgi:H+/Cl- antiporter ClcA